MAKHPTSRRVHRTATDEDAFVAGVLESGVWAKQHSRLLTFGAIAIVVAAGLLFYIRNYRATVSDRATIELTAVRQTVLQGNRQLSLRDLKSFVAKYGDTPSGDEARMMLAQLYVEDGQFQNAVGTIKPAAAKPGGPNGASAALLLGAVYEAGKQLKQAEETYLKVADEARFGFEKRDALERAATLRLQAGNVPGTTELYERALKTLPEDDPERTVYEMRIAEAQASAGRTGS